MTSENRLSCGAVDTEALVGIDASALPDKSYL